MDLKKIKVNRTSQALIRFMEILDSIDTSQTNDDIVLYINNDKIKLSYTLSDKTLNITDNLFNTYLTECDNNTAITLFHCICNIMTDHEIVRIGSN